MKTWTIICNNSVAKFFTGTGLTKDLEPIKEIENERAHLKEQDYQVDRPGRTFGKSGELRHAMESSTAYKETVTEEYCQSIADELNDHFQKGSFERLILVSSPKVLGILRSKMEDVCKKSIVDSVSSDLTHLDVEELNQALKAKISLGPKNA